MGATSPFGGLLLTYDLRPSLPLLQSSLTLLPPEAKPLLSGCCAFPAQTAPSGPARLWRPNRPSCRSRSTSLPLTPSPASGLPWPLFPAEAQIRLAASLPLPASPPNAAATLTLGGGKQE